MAKEPQNPNSVASKFTELAESIKRSNEEMLAFQTDSYLKRKEEEREKLVENRKNFQETREHIIKRIVKAIQVMTRKIVNAILFSMGIIFDLLAFGVVLVLGKIYQVFATTFSGIKGISKAFYILFDYLPRAIPILVSRISRTIGNIIFTIRRLDQAIIRLLKRIGVASSILKFLSKIFVNIRISLTDLYISIRAMIRSTRLFRSVISAIFTIYMRSLPMINFLNKLLIIMRPILSKAAPIISALKMFFKFLGWLGRFAGGLVKIMAGIGKIFGIVGRFMSKLFMFLRPFTPFIRLMGPFVKLVPVLGWLILIVEGIVGFIRGWMRSDGPLLQKIGEGFLGMFSQIIAGLSFGFLSFEDVMGFFDMVTDAIGNFFFMIYDFFANKFLGLIESIYDYIANTVASSWESLKDGVSSFFSMIGDFFTETIPNMFTKFKDAIIESFLVMLRMVNKIDPTGYIQDTINYLEGFKSTVTNSSINQPQPTRFLDDATTRNSILRSAAASQGQLAAPLFLNNSPSINNQTFVKTDVNPHREAILHNGSNMDYSFLNLYGR